MNYRNIKTPETFTKASDVELWLSRFRRYIMATGLVRDIEIVNTFSTLLDDECYRLVESIGFKPTWNENERMMTALFAKPTMNPHGYLQQFTSRTQRPDENVSQFAAALHDIANKSFTHQLIRGGIDNFIKEQFILGLRDQQMAERLRYSHFNDLDSLIMRAKDYEAMQTAYRGQARHVDQQMQYDQDNIAWNANGMATMAVMAPAMQLTTKREPQQWFMPNDSMRSRPARNREESNVFTSHSQSYSQNRGPNQSYDCSLTSSNFTRTPDRSRYNSSYQNASGGNSSMRSSPGCFACGEIGHVARKCPNTHRTAPQSQHQDRTQTNDRYRHNNNYYKLNFDSSNQSASSQGNLDQTGNSRPNISRESTNLLDLGPLACNSMEVHPTIRGKKLKSILDTGSTRTIVSSGVWNTIRNDQTLTERRDIIVETVNGQNLLIKGSFKEIVELNGRRADLEVFVADLNKDCILGLDFLNKVDVVKEKMHEFMNFVAGDDRGFENHPSEHVNNITFTEKDRQELKAVLEKHDDVFSKSLSDLGGCDVTLHEIDTGREKPFKEATRRHPYALHSKIEKQINDMLEAGIIVPSKSEWSSAIVPVPKKDDSVRVCIDYRRLNEITRKDNYPVPRVDDSIDKYHQVKVFSTLDCMADPKRLSQHRSAFSSS